MGFRKEAGIISHVVLQLVKIGMMQVSFDGGWRKDLYLKFYNLIHLGLQQG
jgi:hypothetical protein